VLGRCIALSTKTAARSAADQKCFLLLALLSSSNSNAEGLIYALQRWSGPPWAHPTADTHRNSSSSSSTHARSSSSIITTTDNTTGART
jgi:hypothetical protein